MCFYVLFYSFTMVCTTLDVYLAVYAPFWHRLNVGRREVFLSVLSVALVGALGTGILGVLAPDTMFAYNPTIYMSLNGIGDYLLYGSFNPRYWMGSGELQTKLLAFIFRIDRNRYPKVRRLVACGFI